MAGGRPLRIVWQDGDTAAALKRAFQYERSRHVARRLQALWQFREGRGRVCVLSHCGRRTRSRLGNVPRSLPEKYCVPVKSSLA